MEILVVDDHQLIRTGLREMLPLRFPNSRIYEAASGEAALELVRSQHFDLAVADLFMPGETAFSFLRQLCDCRPELPVVVLSASENGAHIRKCIDYGASAFVPKAASQEALIDAIETALAGGVTFPAVHAPDPDTELPWSPRANPTSRSPANATVLTIPSRCMSAPSCAPWG